MDARVAHGLEKEQLAERFSIIDAARLPEKPSSPNIPAMLLIGLVLGMGSGVGAAALKESTDDTVRTPEALARATSFPVLAGIPEIVTGEDVARQKKLRKLLLAGAAVAFVLFVVLFHFVVMDLDVLWAKLMRRLPL
jgi:hypothetical protein